MRTPVKDVYFKSNNRKMSMMVVNVSTEVVATATTVVTECTADWNPSQDEVDELGRQWVVAFNRSQADGRDPEYSKAQLVSATFKGVVPEVLTPKETIYTADVIIVFKYTTTHNKEFYF